MKVFQRFQTHLLGASLFFSAVTLSVAQTPVLIKDIRPDLSDSWTFYCDKTNPNFIKMNNGKVFFFAEDKSSEPVPILTDGTAAGTARLADVYAGIAHTQIYDEANNKLYFTGRKNIFISSKADEELWVSDGTKAGTVKVKDIEPTEEYGSEPSNFVLLDSKLYFAAKGTKGGLYISDGTDAGTKRLSSSYVNKIFKFNNKVYFGASLTFNGDIKFWETNGTSPGTKVINLPFTNGYGDSFVTDNSIYLYDGYDIKKLNTNDNTLSDVIYDTKANGLVRFAFSIGNKDFFLTVKETFIDPTAKNALYETDGTAAGTKFIKELTTKIPFWNNFAIAESFIATESENPKTGEKELLVTDGTAAGTFEIDLNKADGSNPRNFCRVGNRIYFSAKHTNSDGTKSYGEELMITDGTVAGTKLVADIYVGDQNGYPSGLTYINFQGKPTLFFFASDGFKGKEPYKMEVPLITSNKDIQVKSNLFTLFPNPSNGVIHILTADNATGTTVELSDINGRVLYQSVLNNEDNTINLTLDNGLYFVKLKTTKGEYQVKKLLVMQ